MRRISISAPFALFAFGSLLATAPSEAGLTPVLVRRIDAPPAAARFGRSVDAADFDGDGTRDFGIGSDSSFVYSGSDGRLLRILPLRGDELDFAGDMNGDGVVDLAVGDASGRNVTFYSGKDSARFSIGNYEVGSDEGESIASMGDVTGDGLPDLLIGCADPARARIFSLRGGTTISVETTGQSATALGDVDGDGWNDFAAGRNGLIGVFSSRSGVRLFDVVGNDPVLGSADIDGDGVKDLLLSAPIVGPDAVDAVVRAYSGRDGHLLLSVVTASDSDCLQFGCFFRAFVAGIGDIDGDGREDFAASLAGIRLGTLNGAGTVSVFSGANGDRLARIDGTETDGNFGWSLAAAGDLDGDGIGDLLIGAPGAHPSVNGASGSAFVYRLVAGPAPVAIDILPGNCPNLIPQRSSNAIEVAVLGSLDVDPALIDAASVRLSGVPVLRERPHARDLGGPASEGDACACGLGPVDGFQDRTFQFDARLVRALLPVSGTRMLEFEARLVDGRDIAGRDCAALGVRTNGIHLDEPGVTPGIRPNPVARGAGTTLTFLAESGGERITICDVRGRIVRRIAIPTDGLGLAQATWDGRDDRGVLVPVGLYLARRASGEAIGRLLIVER